jgi:hypothetical protein
MRVSVHPSPARDTALALLRGALVAMLAASLGLAVTLRNADAQTLGYGYDPDAEVDVELVLAVDISQSMDTEEQEDAARRLCRGADLREEFLDAIRSARSDASP